MRILLSNHPEFVSSDWYLDIQQGAEYLYLPTNPDGSGAVSAKYFRLENIPSSYEIEIGLGYRTSPVHFSTKIILRTTNFITNTGVIEYFSALIHPNGVIAPGVFKVTEAYNELGDDHIFSKMNIR